MIRRPAYLSMPIRGRRAGCVQPRGRHQGGQGRHGAWGGGLRLGVPIWVCPLRTNEGAGNMVPWR